MPKKEETLKDQLMKCEKIISEAQAGAANAKRALYKILQEELWKAEFASEAQYLKARGYTRGTISHIRSFVELVDELNIPEDLCPSEFAVRPLAKKAFAEDRAEIYGTACEFAKKRSEGATKIPTLPDIKKAIKEYCDNQSQEIILRAIDVKVPADTDFIKGVIGDSAIAEKIKSSQQLLAVLKDFFRKKTVPANVREATENFLSTLRSRENLELDKFFQKKSNHEDGDTDNEE